MWAPCQGFRCARPPRQFLSVLPGSQAAYQGAHPPGVSGVGPRPLIGVCAHWGTLGLCNQAAGPLIRVHAHPGFQWWAPSPLIWVHANRASGVCWGYLSQVHSPGAEGLGVQEVTAAVESSLTSRCVFYFLFLFKKFLLFKPPWSSTWPLTQSSLALSQESCSRPCTPARGFSHPGPHSGPKDLIVLKHSSYRLIFQCPLSLVSSLHIC